MSDISYETQPLEVLERHIERLGRLKESCAVDRVRLTEKIAMLDKEDSKIVIAIGRLMDAANVLRAAGRT